MLKVSDSIPHFEGINQYEELVKSTDFAGKKWVIFFYPKASTPGCTLQVCNLRDNYQKILSENYELLGVSADSVKNQLNFSDKQHLPFSLLADERREIINAFGVWGTKKFMGKTYDGILRTTFIIDQNQCISQVITDVNTKEHSSQILGF